MDRSPDAGFVFAVSGADYLPLAENAAETIRRHHPDHPIDLFTDQAVEPEIFDRVIPLEAQSFRPKFEALRRSRFDRTIALDADILCLAPVDDVFTLLDRFDLAAAHEPRRNSETALMVCGEPLPAAFPQLNSGVVAIRKSARIEAFFADMEQALAESGTERDQPVLRRQLYDSDLRIWVLPPEYNFMTTDLLEACSEQQAAPRILHLTRLHRHFGPDGGKRQLTDITSICGPAVQRHLNALLAADQTLGGTGNRVRPMFRQGLTGIARGLSQGIGKRLAQIRPRR